MTDSFVKSTRRVAVGLSKRKATVALALVAIAASTISMCASRLLVHVTAALGSAALVALVALTCIRLEQRLVTLQAPVLHLLPQIQSLFYIYSQLNFRQPLPAMGGWAILPDFGALLISFIRDKQPKLVLEASTGVSTLLIGYCLQQQRSAGMVIALEHDPRFAAESSAEVARHGLQDVVKIIHAPLQEYSLNGRNFLWYDTRAIQELPCDIDLLVIDGPPSTLQPLCRYPALPLLYSRLSATAAVLLDDAGRRDEHEIIRLWRAEHPDLSSRYLPFSKGAELLVRTHKNGNSG